MGQGRLKITPLRWEKSQAGERRALAVAVALFAMAVGGLRIRRCGGAAVVPW